MKPDGLKFTNHQGSQIRNIYDISDVKKYKKEKRGYVYIIVY